MQQALIAIAQHDAIKENATNENVTKSAEDIRKLESVTGGSAMTSFLSEGNFASLNKYQVETISGMENSAELGALLSQNGIDIASLGFDNVDDLFIALQREAFNYQTESDNIKNTARNFNFSMDSFDDYSLAVQKKVSNAILEAYKVAGRDGVNALTELLSDSSLSEDQIDNVLNKFESVDLTDSSSINEFVSYLNDIGIKTDSLGDSWDLFLQKVNSGTAQWIKNTQQVFNNLAYIRDTVDNIKMGDLVTDEEYEKMRKINPEVAKYFIKTNLKSFWRKFLKSIFL